MSRKLKEEMDNIEFENKKKEKKEYQPLISVIIPVYNAEKYIKKCLETLINQTYSNLEIICVDDGSTDHSVELLEMYAKKDDRIKIFTQKNAGPAAARNLALKKVTGEYISFVDADDFLQYNAYEILVNKLNENKSWELIIFGGNIVGEANEYFASILTTSYCERRNCKPDVIFKEKAAKPFLWLHLIKRSLLTWPNPIYFDESMKLGEDQIFQFQYVPRAKNILVIEDKLYNYRIAQNASLMQLYNHRRITKTNLHFEIVTKVVEEWKKAGLYDSYKDELWTWAVSLIYWTIRDFPNEFRNKYAQKFIDLLEITYNEGDYIILEYEIEHYMEMKEWILNDYSLEMEIRGIVSKIEREKYEIEETLRSKAFKAGTMLTPAGERLDMDSFGA